MTPARHLLWALPLLILAAVASDLPGTRGMHPAAVLLGWVWELAPHAACVRHSTSEANDAGRVYGCAPNPARSWLLAILAALIAEAEARDGKGEG